MRALIYHNIAEADVADCYTVSPSRFGKHLGWLQAQRLRTPTLRQCLDAGGRLTSVESTVVLTFDDGFAGWTDRALPLLSAHGMKAVFFVAICFVEAAEGISLLQLRELMGEGMEIGCHGWSHPGDIRRTGPRELQHETHDAKHWLEDRLQTEVITYAFPQGLHDARTAQAARAAGFALACTGEGGIMGPHTDPWHLPRFGITALTSLRALNYYLTSRTLVSYRLRRAAVKALRCLVGTQRCEQLGQSLRHLVLARAKRKSP